MITIEEIAQLANVSRGTVDRVLHNRGRVSGETEKKIRHLLERYDYKPNILARSLSLSKTFNFCALIPNSDQDGSYWELPRRGIQKAEKELNIYKIKITFLPYDKYSEKSFNKSCNRFLRNVNDYDGLLLAPVLAKATEEFIAQLPSCMPYVFIDSYIPQSNSLTYVGEDSFQSGRLAAKLMNVLMNSKGRIAVFHVLPRNYHIDDRANGFFAFFADHSDVEIRFFNANRRKDEYAFFNTTAEILKEMPDVTGIFIPNACTFQVAEYLELHSDRKIFLIGYDLVEKNKYYLRKGLIDFIISQRSALQGYKSVYFLFEKIVLGNAIEKKMLMPLDVITQENIDFYQD